MKMLPRFSFGMGDRFGMEGRAQLSAVMAACARGAEITPVWNKSHREHCLTGTHPSSLREEAEEAVRALAWQGLYFVDADHIRRDTVEDFLESCDFFTLDVAEQIGTLPHPQDLQDFCQRYRTLVGEHELPGQHASFILTAEDLEKAARQFLAAMREAGAIYRHIAARKLEPFAVEVSVDEAQISQTPAELFLLLVMLAEEQVPVQTIAPKFAGRFNKGVDYQGDLERFESEFEVALGVIQLAIARFGLPENLKISVHSGSDKFSLYPILRRLTQKHQAGLHLKTAGTTWLEEITGLARAGGSGLAMAQEIYREALAHFDEILAPYAAVVAVDQQALPAAGEVSRWSAEEFASALEHNPACPAFNPHFRQLLHVAFQVAAGMGQRFRDALLEHRDEIELGVRRNLVERHLLPLFGPAA